MCVDWLYPVYKAAEKAVENPARRVSEVPTGHTDGRRIPPTRAPAIESTALAQPQSGTATGS